MTDGERVMQFTDFLVPASVGVAIVPILSVGFACLFTRLWSLPRFNLTDCTARTTPRNPSPRAPSFGW